MIKAIAHINCPDQLLVLIKASLQIWIKVQGSRSKDNLLTYVQGSKLLYYSTSTYLEVSFSFFYLKELRLFLTVGFSSESSDSPRSSPSI